MSKNPLIRKSTQAAVTARIGAKLIDMFVATLIAILAGPLGVLLGSCYLAIADGLQNGQSVGKKAVGLAVILETTGDACDFRHSAIRNLPLLMAWLPTVIPGLGWWITILVGIPWMILELYLILALDSGRRIGDALADTIVTRSDPLPISTNADADNQS